ncbi:hypothetical protein ACS0TY_022421 [Phlomoides rotata]
MVKYCSEACQRSHWNSEHNTKCKGTDSSRSVYALRKMKTSPVATGEMSKFLKQSNKIFFPYEEFVQYFNWGGQGYPPCGLLNYGNSCFANVVLQCLSCTRPLVAYLLVKGHKITCQLDKWCFLCEFQTHVERANWSHTPFSPINILSQLPLIGENLWYGRQEDAHEFMRCAIGTMQYACLDEFGGEKAVHPRYQETTLVQHIFGGRFQSQVTCIRCDNVSNQFENMMDLAVEIHGDVGSLEECLEQFTAKEWLHGDNMYKCDRCNDYVIAWKRLSIQRAPNILTIALKRFQSGYFGKLNKRVTFPETLDLKSYMSELEDGNDVYKLYAVIVHLDLLNASFFGHYICYVKDFRGNWYRVDDCKVDRVDLDEVLSQGAYMLLYSRICARSSCLLPSVMLKKEEDENVGMQTVDPSLTRPTDCSSAAADADAASHDSSPVISGHLSSANCSEVEVSCEEESSSIKNAEDARENVDTRPHDSDDLSISPEVERYVYESRLKVSPEELRPAMNGTFEDSMCHSEVREENSANLSCMPEKGKHEGHNADEKSKDSSKKSNGENYGAKYKPLFRPGFLGKQLWKEFDSISPAGNTKNAASLEIE